MSDEQARAWTDEQYEAYALGMQTEREHQEALARLAVKKHQEELDQLRQQLAAAQDEVESLRIVAKSRGNLIDGMEEDYEELYQALKAAGAVSQQWETLANIHGKLMLQHEARVAELEAGLQWALDTGGWRLLYYANDIPAIIDATDMYDAKVRRVAKEGE